MGPSAADESASGPASWALRLGDMHVRPDLLGGSPARLRFVQYAWAWAPRDPPTVCALLCASSWCPSGPWRLLLPPRPPRRRAAGGGVPPADVDASRRASSRAGSRALTPAGSRPRLVMPAGYHDGHGRGHGVEHSLGRGGGGLLQHNLEDRRWGVGR